MKDLKGLKIHCDNEQEKKELLEEATNQGFTWISCGKKPLVYENALRKNDYRFHVDKKMSCYESGCISYKEYKAMSEFTKADLKPCMVVVRRNGEVAGVIENKNGIGLQSNHNSIYCYMSNYDDDLKQKDERDVELDIMKVYGFNYHEFAISVKNRPLLWERKEEKPKYYNGKVVCVDNRIDDNNFKKGRIYEVVNGTVNGFPMHSRKLTDFKDLQYYFSLSGNYSAYEVKFIELVEEK